VPVPIKAQALVLTDCRDAYALAIPANQHIACEKQSGQISIIERLNRTLRQRVSRLCEKAYHFQRAIGFIWKLSNISLLMTIWNVKKSFEHYF
jgi:IS1 family transposase